MMNDKTGSQARGHRGPRLTAILSVTIGLALLTAACGSGSSAGTSSAGSSQAGGSTSYQKELAYAQCMRSHGVPKFPDPTSNGSFVNTGQFKSGTPQFQSADKACRHLLPNGGQPTQAQRQQLEKRMLKFAQCMRSHGVPKFPDPTSNGSLSLRGSGVDRRSPQFQHAQQACQPLLRDALHGASGSGK